MPTLRRVISDSRTQLDAERLDALVRRQHGVVSRQQLRDVRLSDTLIARWLQAGRLHRLHRQVFAVGHTALSIQGRLYAALLYAGPDAVLSHTTAAWAWSLVDAEPRRIHLTVPGRRPSLPEVRAHHSRQVERVDHLGFPLTPVARTLVDIAGMVTARQVRRSLAEADYRGLLEPGDVTAALRPGRPGSAALRTALRSHMPELAATLSELEQRFLELCEAARVPLPDVNARISRMRVDTVWRDAGLAVELDGRAAHSHWAASKRDRQRELALRAHGFQVVRYTWEQVTRQSDAVVADLRRLLGL